MATVTKYFCDRCGMEVPLVRNHIQVMKLSPANISVRMWDKDFCSECLHDFQEWLLTAPTDAGSLERRRGQDEV